MKWLFILVLLPAVSFADCQVEGISDSPQKLRCQFGQETKSLSCRNNTYFINEDKVVLTWHEEVEEGNSPLLFKTDVGTLRIVKEERSAFYQASYMSSQEVLGRCR